MKLAAPQSEKRTKRPSVFAISMFLLLVACNDGNGPTQPTRSTVSVAKSSTETPLVHHAHFNITSFTQPSGDGPSGEIPYRFEVFIDADGDLSELEPNDIILSVGETFLEINEVDASHDGEAFHIRAFGDFGGALPLFGQYQVTIRDANGQTAEPFVTSALEDFPKDAPQMLFPHHSGFITESQPTFSWEPFESVYLGQPVTPWSYEIGLHFSNDETFSAFPIDGTQTSLEYQTDNWSPAQPPDLVAGRHALTIHSNHAISSDFDFEHHRVITFTVVELGPVNTI